MKKFLVLPLIILLSTSLVLTSYLQTGSAQSGTNVNGILTANTTWSRAGSPYTLTGNVLVNGGVTLTVEAGVRVNLGDFSLVVNGSLQSLGSSSASVVFSGGKIDFTQYCKSWDEGTHTGCLLESTSTNATVSTQGTTMFRNSLFTGGINVGTLTEPAVGTPTIKNCTIKNQGILLAGSPNAVIDGNVISGCSDAGINAVTYPVSKTVEISNNLIVNNTRGIEIVVSTALAYNHRYVLTNNTVANNQFGVTLWENWYPTPLTITLLNNNIYSNTEYNLDLGYNRVNGIPVKVNSTSNYWGTTSQQEISQKIYDYYDNYNLGEVLFSPYLTSPNTQAPTGIIASAGPGGYIYPNGVIRVRYGGSQGFSFVAESGYHEVGITMNGTFIGSVSSIALNDIRGTTTISVTFAPNQPETSPTPVPYTSSSPAPTPQQSPAVTPTPNPSQKPVYPMPTIAFTCQSSTSATAFDVKINGNLTFNGMGLAGKSVRIAYSVSNGRSWESLTSVNTDSTGKFTVEWRPSVTGNILVNASYEGDSSYSGTASTVNLAILPLTSDNSGQLFSVASNSTISDLIFDSTHRQIRFTVAGPTGTTGFVDAYIAKSLISDISTLKVTSGGNKLDFDVVPQQDSWLIQFSYHHSTHAISMDLGTQTLEAPNDTSSFVIVGALALAVLVVIASIVLIRRRKRSPNEPFTKE
jgi:hypothetical protein